MVTIRENINRENFNPRIPGICEWDRTSKKWAGPGCGCYCENINCENPKTANPQKFNPVACTQTNPDIDLSRVV